MCIRDRAYCFYRNKIHEIEMGSKTFLYQEYKGNYWMANIMAQRIIPQYYLKLIEDSKDQQIPITDIFIAWDNPNWVASENECRSAGGIFVDPKVADPKDPKWILQKDFMKVKTIDAGKILRLDVDIKQRKGYLYNLCLLYTSPSPRDQRGSRMPSSA
eukprot:TRINITY_DN13714_c0_g1_i1.p1 TRINITY_DN13714_c0_g1~~TRINITY_DN13714_c0_g1_i1.p1  ORF type:complete len:168 (+),score=65.64 TRINITY_DN13714_c0_g1_i1:33-506(+)